MTYHPTIGEDLQRAKEILAKGRTAPERAADIWLQLQGADVYAACKLLESFVAEIEDYRHSFALYHNASMALMHAYKTAHPDVPDLVWPDTTKVNEWAVAEIERLRGWLDEALGEWEYAANYKGEYLAAKHGDIARISEIREALKR